MSNQHAWEQVRAKNPIVKRNAWVAYRGRNYRVANLSAGGNVILRHQVTAHPTDIETPNLDSRGKIFEQISANEGRMERIRERLKIDPDDTLLMKELAMVSGIIQGLNIALRCMSFELAA